MIPSLLNHALHQTQAGSDNLLAATYAIGNWTLHRLGTNGTDSTPFARSLRHLVNTCHQAARTNPDRRRSSLEHLTSTPVDEPSLYGALTRWATEAEKALHRRLVTSGTFAMLASDLTVLTAATHHTLTPRMHKELEDLQEVTKTLTAALTGWKQIAAWPTNMRLGGPRALDYIAASRELRSYIAAELTGPDDRAPLGGGLSRVLGCLHRAAWEGGHGSIIAVGVQQRHGVFG